jgi:fatty-acyl-CoA synthase
LRAFLAERFAKWQLPDSFIFVDELPHTSTGKLLKVELRRRYQDWEWAGDSLRVATRHREQT